MLIGIEFAHARLLDQRIGLEPRPRLGDVEERQRFAAVDAGDGQDLALAHVRRAGDRDDSDAEPQRAGDPVPDAAILGGHRIELPAAFGAEKSRADENSDGEGDLELARRGAVQSDWPAQRRLRRTLAAQHHPVRRGFEGDAGQPRPGRLSPSEHRAQQSHAASSANQATGLR